jgi:uncharacterized protein YqgV (UPF0045/DUF77 family)
MNGLEITSIQLTGLGVLITVIAGLWGIFKVLTSGTEAAKDVAREGDESLRKEMIAEIAKVDAVFSKSIHDKYNSITALFTRLEVEIDRLKRETVRREEMTAIEARLTAAFTKIEGKLDNMTEKLAILGPLEKQVQAFETRLEAANRGGKSRDI